MLSLPHLHLFFLALLGRCSLGVRDRLTLPEQGPFWEGDIRIASHFKTAYKSTQWPGARVPYYIDERGFDDFDLEMIRIGLKGFQRYTCVKLHRTWDPIGEDVGNYVNITREVGCWSFMGLQKMGGQTMSLGHGCTNAVGTVQHEMMHCLGFNHEHNRPDRDEFLDIRMENVKTAAVNNFERMRWAEVDGSLLETRYDAASVLHYASNSFSKDFEHLETIVPKASLSLGERHEMSSAMGQRRHMSILDVKDINLLYNCHWEPVKALPEDAPPESEGEVVWGCEFGGGFCGMTQVHKAELSDAEGGDEKDWMRVRGPSPSVLSGPSERDDYEGFYLLLYSGGHSLSGERAKIATPTLRSDHSHLCLAFSYHMENERELAEGDSLMGTLKVLLLQDSQAHPEPSYKTVWERSGSRHVSWQRVHLPLRLSSHNPHRKFRLIFEGIIRSRSNSDIAITWISVKQGQRNYKHCN